MILMSEYNILDSDINLFLITNFLASFICTIWFLFIFRVRKYLFIKPSILVLFCSHVFLQWPLALFSTYCQKFLAEPITLQILIHSYIFFGLFIASGTFINESKETWARIISKPALSLESVFRDCFILLGFAVGFIIVYFNYNPFESTGIYAVFAKPENYDVMRDLSYNLLPLPMKYGLSILQSVLLPMIGSLAMYALVRDWKRITWRKALGYVMIIAVCIFFISLTGARYAVVKLLLSAFIVVFLFRAYKVSFLKMALGFGLILIPAALITLLREGKAFSLYTLADYLINGIIVHRILCTPLQVGLWHLQYSELHGFFGPGAIPKFGALFDMDPLIVPKIIGQYYLPNPNFETHSDCAYLLSYYSYFGLWSIPLSLILLLSLDWILKIYSRISISLLIPCVAVISVACLEFVQSDFTTILISHGFAITVLFFWFWDNLRKKPVFSLIFGDKRAVKVRHRSIP